VTGEGEKVGVGEGGESKGKVEGGRGGWWGGKRGDGEQGGGEKAEDEDGWGRGG